VIPTFQGPNSSAPTAVHLVNRIRLSKAAPSTRSQCNERYDSIDSVRDFYGDGTVYVADKNRVTVLDENLFNVESLHPKCDGDHWVANEVVVALGSDVSRKKALEALRLLIKRIESEIEKGH